MANQAIEAVSELMESHAKLLKEYLQILLPNILIAGFSAKIREDTKPLVQRMLSALETAFDAQQLVTSSIKLIESSDAKLKCGALRFLRRLAGNSAADAAITGSSTKNFYFVLLHFLVLSRIVVSSTCQIITSCKFIAHLSISL